jgi:hypothetical protein
VADEEHPDQPAPEEREQRVTQPASDHPADRERDGELERGQRDEGAVRAGHDLVVEPVWPTAFGVRAGDVREQPADVRVPEPAQAAVAADVRAVGLPSMSVRARCLRREETQLTTAPWAALDPSTPRRASIQQGVAKDRCVSRRWNPTVTLPTLMT